MNHVARYVPLMVDVQSVACFGLGILNKDMELTGEHVFKNYLQHIVALSIHDNIERLQKKPKGTIPI
jgi:hypothetical protein